jgi:hypothetical protein
MDFVERVEALNCHVQSNLANAIIQSREGDERHRL